MYFAFGGVDAYVIVGMPDNSTAAAFALAVNQGGAATTNTIVLIRGGSRRRREEDHRLQRLQGLTHR